MQRVLAIAVVLAATVTGCAGAVDGAAVPAADGSYAGVVPTTRVPAHTVECDPPLARATARTVPARFAVDSDAGAPIVDLLLPDTWRVSAPGGEQGTFELTGPGGMTGAVTISRTPLRPVDAFAAYAEERDDEATVVAQGVLSADFCGYSSQKLIGTRAPFVGAPVNYAHRITHVWTDDPAANYLVAVSIEGPAGTPDFDDAEQLMTAEHPIRLP